MNDPADQDPRRDADRGASSDEESAEDEAMPGRGGRTGLFIIVLLLGLGVCLIECLLEGLLGD